MTILVIYVNTPYRRYFSTDSTISYGCQMNNYYSWDFTIIHWIPATIPWHSSISAPPSLHRPRTPSSYSVIAIKAKCVCQALFQRVTHRMGLKQFSTAGGHRRTIELCPTKLSMETSGYPAWPAGRTCSVNQNRLLLYQKARLFRLQVVHECSEKYLLLTHRFAVFTHA